MLFGNIGAALLTPLMLFPSFGNYSFDLEAPKAQAQANQEFRIERQSNWGWSMPAIRSIDPIEGEVGTEVTLTGRNFDEDSQVRFGSSYVDEVEVADDGRSLSFVIPTEIEINCPWYARSCDSTQDVDPGKYAIRVQNEYRSSNVIHFTVIDSEDPTEEDLRITDIDGPDQLLVDEEGKWTVKVAGAAEGNLRYAVVWGDEANALMRIFSADEPEYQTSATFTHTYRESGVYTPEFTVIDEEGNEVSAESAEVRVTEEGDMVPVIDHLEDESVQASNKVVIIGSGFTADSNVFVNGNEIEEVEFVDETKLTFLAPDLEPGDYRVVVQTGDERSNAVRLTIEEDQVEKGRLSVSGISAPTVLDAGEMGEWEVFADTNLKGNLRYSVVWGDEATNARRAMMNSSVQTSASFTHAYEEAGTYKPKFTVTDEQGNTASASATVVVK